MSFGHSTEFYAKETGCSPLFLICSGLISSGLMAAVVLAIG